MSIHAQFFRGVILKWNLGRTDLVFGVQTGFISRSVHARLQVSVFSGYDLCQTDRQTDNILASFI